MFVFGADKRDVQGEEFSETKKRLEKRTGIKGKSFEKIKFAVVRRAQFSRPHYLSDGTALCSRSCLRQTEALTDD